MHRGGWSRSLGTMRALWLENQELSLRDIPEPVAGAGEARVRVRLCGVCATDLELVRGYYPYTGVPGHEFVGEVIETPGSSGWEGVRVVGEINAACGRCTACRAGRPRHCSARTVLGIAGRHGAFAEQLVLPVENLHRVPDALSDEAAVFTEPLAAACRILEQVAVRGTDRVLLVGAGRLGQLIARVLGPTGCSLQVVARHDRQRALLEACGIKPCAPEDIEAGSYDLAVEATGSPDGFAVARRALRPLGALVLKSTYKGEVSVDFSSLVVDEISVVGSRCGPFVPALELLATGRVDPLPLIEARYPLARGLEAFGHAGRRGVLKILIDPTCE